MGRATAEPAGEAACGIYERQGVRVFRFCVARLRSREEAEDATQTTFLYALAALRRGVVPVAEASWLLAIADNVCKSRRQEATRRSRFEVVEDPQSLQRVSAPAGAAVETLMPLDDALGRLTDAQRQALLLREWRGLSSREIADHLGMTPGAVDVLLLRARRALANGLEAPVPARRRLRSLDLASLAGAAKSFFGGGLVAKSTVATVVAALGASLGVVALGERDAGQRAPEPAAPSAASPADRALVGRALQAARPAGQARRNARSAETVRAAPRPVSPLPPPAAPAPAAEPIGTPEQAPAPVADESAAAPPTPSPAAGSVTVAETVEPVLDGAEPLVEGVETVTSTVEPVVAPVTAAAEPVVETVTPTVDAVLDDASVALPAGPVLP